MSQGASATASGLELREAQLADLEPVARLMDAERPGAGRLWLTRMPWRGARNPWSGGHPLGCVLIADGDCVGYYFAIAQPIVVGATTGIATWGVDLYVRPDHRGGLASLALIRAVHRLAHPMVVATDTANPLSAGIWLRLGAIPLPQGEVSLLLPIRWARVALAMAARRVWGWQRPIAADEPDSWRGRVGERVTTGGWRSGIATEFSGAARLWSDVRHRFGLSTDRTPEFLAWRYGPGSPGGVVVMLHDRDGRARGWYAYRISIRGARLPIRVVRVLDLVAAPDDGPAIDACIADLVHRARGCAGDVIEVQGLGASFRARFEAAAFRSQVRDANPFLVLPAGAKPDPADGEWHLVPADGDGGFS
ncbi:MAG TPA: hypothetical protein VFI79_18160 [Gemmatimonadales bacterium]|nr:hypothetical protein [Gemmatimonadales bacterium]